MLQFKEDKFRIKNQRKSQKHHQKYIINNNHVTARKIVLTAWKLVFVRSVSLRPSSGFLECRNLTKRKHGALLSKSSGYPCKETKYMMKHSVQRLPFFMSQETDIGIDITLFIDLFFFFNN